MRMARSTGRPFVSAMAMGAVALALVVVTGCVPPPSGRGTQPPAGATPTIDTRPASTPTPAGPTPSLTFSRPTATPQPTFLAYRVRSGDTITSIARAHRTTIRSIGYWNRAMFPSLDPESSAYNPNDVRVGWTLLLIPGVEVDPDEITPPPSGPSATEEAGD